MTAPNRSVNNLFDLDVDKLCTFVQTNLPKLVPDQNIAYDRIMHEIMSQHGRLYFLDAPGRTGKNFLIPLKQHY